MSPFSRPHSKSDLSDFQVFRSARSWAGAAIVALFTLLAQVSPTQAAGEEAIINALLKIDPQVDMVWIPQLDCFVSKYETTQSAYQAVMGKNPSTTIGQKHPVENVSWFEAMEYCEKLTTRARAAGAIPAEWSFSLPSDKQWDVFVGDATLADAVTSARVKQTSSSPVGSKNPNNFGLYDVRGNVWEWSLDWLDETKKTKVARGSAWMIYYPTYLEASYRFSLPPIDRVNVGFRTVLVKTAAASSAPKR